MKYTYLYTSEESGFEVVSNSCSNLKQCLRSLSNDATDNGVMNELLEENGSRSESDLEDFINGGSDIQYWGESVYGYEIGILLTTDKNSIKQFRQDCKDKRKMMMR